MMLGLSQEQTGKVLKALYAAVVAALGMLSTILVGNQTLEDITTGQWVTIGLFSLTAFGGIFGLSTWAGPTNGSGGKPKA